MTVRWQNRTVNAIVKESVTVEVEGTVTVRLALTRAEAPTGFQDRILI